MADVLRHFLDGLERRRRVTRWIDVYLESAFVASLVAAIVLLAVRLLAAVGVTEAHTLARATALAVVGVVLLGPALAATLLSLKRGAPVAAEADRVLRLDERLVTAAEFLDRPASGVASLLLRDVGPRVEGTPPKRVYPLPRIGYRAGLVLGLLALAVVAMSPPGLTWERIRQNPLSLLGTDEPEAPPDEVAAQKPAIDFEGMPREGKAPLTVYFLGYTRSNVDAWEWDFGDGETARGERAQEHVYKNPGWYAVSVRAAGAACSKERYIHVTSDPGPGDATARPMAFPETGGGMPQTGDPPKRPDIETKPHDVDPLNQTEAPRVEKQRAVHIPGPGGESTEPKPEFPETFESYRRVAEESIGRDRIPAPLADYVRAYFDRIRP